MCSTLLYFFEKRYNRRGHEHADRGQGKSRGTQLVFTMGKNNPLDALLGGLPEELDDLKELKNRVPKLLNKKIDFLEEKVKDIENKIDFLMDLIDDLVSFLEKLPFLGFKRKSKRSK